MAYKQQTGGPGGPGENLSEDLPEDWNVLAEALRNRSTDSESVRTNLSSSTTG